MSFQDTPMSVAEQHVTDAWNDYVTVAQAARAATDTPSMSSAARMKLHERMLDAYDRFSDAYRLLNEPMPPSKERERNQLACEGVLLISILAAFIGLFLPDLEAGFWPLAFTFAAVGLLGAWSHRFTGRLSASFGGRP